MPKKNEVNLLAPSITEMPSVLMAVVETVGDPSLVSGPAIKALYGAVYKIKFDLKKQGLIYKVDSLRARWPIAGENPRDGWIGRWALPVPTGTTSVIQKVPGVSVVIETWHYGLVAQILHLGPFATENATIETLLGFISSEGYQISGTHEEQYLTRMDAKIQKTLIRYPVTKNNRLLFGGLPDSAE